MNINPTTFYIIFGILVAFSGTLMYIIRNLMIKVENYEDVVHEVGEFFKQMQAVQEELNRYMLPENYGKKEIES